MSLYNKMADYVRDGDGSVWDHFTENELRSQHDVLKEVSDELYGFDVIQTEEQERRLKMLEAGVFAASVDDEYDAFEDSDEARMDEKRELWQRAAGVTAA